MKYLLLPIAALLLPGCATQRTLCEDLTPEDCAAVVYLIHRPVRPMEAVFIPWIRRDPISAEEVEFLEKGRDDVEKMRCYADVGIYRLEKPCDR